MNLVLSGFIDPTLLNLAVDRTRPRDVVQLHANAHRLIGAADDEASRREIDRLCEIARVDHAFVPEGLRFSDFKLLAMDMDSTLITIECIDEIADFAGKKKEVAAITEAAMRGEIPDFAESLRRRVALLAGTDSAVLGQVYDQRLELTPGAETFIACARKFHLQTVILSGGFTYFCERLLARLPIDGYSANELEITDGKLTGRLIGKLIDANAKADTAALRANNIGANRSQIIVIGDGANDIQMMRISDFSIAYRAKPVVMAFAAYKIEYGGLNTIIDWLV